MDIAKETKTLEERGIHPESFFIVAFEDGKEISEHEMNWSSIATMQDIHYPNGNKRKYYVSNIPLKWLKMKHHSLLDTIYLEKEQKAYQAICERVTWFSDGSSNKECFGRIFGLVDKDNNVIKEVFLDGRTNDVIGLTYRGEIYE